MICVCNTHSYLFEVLIPLFWNCLLLLYREQNKNVLCNAIIIDTIEDLRVFSWVPNAMLARTSRGFSFYTLKGIQVVRFCLDMILFISTDYWLQNVLSETVQWPVSCSLFTSCAHEVHSRLHYIKILVYHFNIPIHDMFIVLSMHCWCRHIISEHNSDSWELPGL